VGLIFLSAMASAVVWECDQAGVGEKDTVATALMTLTLSTSCVGLMIILTGEEGATCCYCLLLAPAAAEVAAVLAVSLCSAGAVRTCVHAIVCPHGVHVHVFVLMCASGMRACMRGCTCVIS
jgi:hypothetical protein